MDNLTNYDHEFQDQCVVQQTTVQNHIGTW